MANHNTRARRKFLFALTLRKISKKTGHAAGLVLRILPLHLRKAVCVLCATLAHHTPRRVYFMVYELLEGVMERIFYTGEHSVFVERTMHPGFVMRLDITKMAQRKVYLSKIYEPHVTDYLHRNLKEGDLFVDVGANVGYYALMAAALVGDAGAVIALEPEKENYARLVDNVQANRFGHVVCVNKAAAADGGTKTLNINPLNEGGHSIENLGQYHGSGRALPKDEARKIFTNIAFEQSVETETLDKIVQHLSPKLIKIDVEGFELDVLKGMGVLLSKNSSPHIVCEVSRKKEEIFEFLLSYGYKVFSLDEGNKQVEVSTDIGKRDYLFKKDA